MEAQQEYDDFFEEVFTELEDKVIPPSPLYMSPPRLSVLEIIGGHTVREQDQWEVMKSTCIV